MVTTRSGASPCSIFPLRGAFPSLPSSAAAAPPAPDEAAPPAAAVAEGGEIAWVAASDVKDRMLRHGQQISAAAQPFPRK